jgi:dTDP-4-dehydrorhamnose reductase
VRILIAGVNGMLGGTLFRHLGSDPTLQVKGVMRGDPSEVTVGFLAPRPNTSLEGNVAGPDDERFVQVFANFKSDVTINCIGWRRRPRSAAEAVGMVTANSLWPHRLAMLAGDLGARLIHFSSDGVFSGERGHYREDDVPDPVDAYGLSKLLGEPDYPHCLILRTSMIGHASKDSDQLVDWLMRQKGKISGYQRAIFSGLPTIEIASIVREILLPRTDMAGIWHLAAAPISKFELLRLIVERYDLDVEVVPTLDPVIDRSLDASRFRAATDYIAPSWSELVYRMHEFR